jgi:3-hydroxyacyl-CoA dehydrogenase
MSSSFNQVTVLGAGVLGAQISFQIAYRGFEVTTYEVSDAALKQSRQRFKGIAAVYPTEVEGATAAAAQETVERIRFTTQLASAVQGADLVIEAVPESLELKRDVFARIAASAPPAAVFVTNSSTLVPSELMDSTGRPDRFWRCTSPTTSGSTTWPR